jgi:hypothetical protein
MPNPNYVCTLCSQTFTRRWRGSVHNANIHAGLAKIVRLLDYVIGRANGEYKPSDPSRYRRLNKHLNWVKRIDKTSYADQKTRETHRKEIQDILDNRMTRQGLSWLPNYGTTTEKGQHQYNTENKSNLEPADKFSEGINKLAELKRLASKYLPADKVQNILLVTNLCCQDMGDNSPLDIALEELRKMVKLRESIDYLNGSGS